jgi:integrase
MRSLGAIQHPGNTPKELTPMSDRKRLTLRDVRALKPGEEKIDPSLPRFGARRRKGPAVTFFVAYTTAAGMRRRQKIGELGLWTPDSARRVALQILAEVDKGGDPQGDKLALRTAMTFDEFFDLYIADAEAGRILGRGGRPKRASTIRFDRGAIRAHLSPSIGSRLLASFSHRDADGLMHGIADGRTARTIKGKARGLGRVTGGRGIATRTMGLLGSMMSHAVSLGLIESNPCSRLRRFAGEPRTRRLGDDEFAALSSGLRASEGKTWPPAIACLKFLALTGWRSGEALGLRWKDVDLVRRTARLGDTKTGASMRPLSHAACDLLRGLTRIDGVALVFPASRPGVVMSGFKRHARRILAAAGLPGEVTPHVLRHSFASTANDLGLTEATVAMMIGHKGRSVTSRYTHAADAPLLAAADAVADRIIELMGEACASGKVLELCRVSTKSIDITH